MTAPNTNSNVVNLPWADPRPLELREREPYPIDSLPEVVRQFVQHRADELKSDHALVGTGVAPVLAAACGSARIRLNTGWSEPGAIWTAVVAEPGSRKSAALDSAIAPLRAAQAEAKKEDALTRPAKERGVVAAERAVAKAERQLDTQLDGGTEECPATDDTVEAAEAELNLAVADLKAVRARVGFAPRIDMGGFSTDEKLHDELARHKNLLVTVAEGETWLEDVSSGHVDKDIFLQGWSQERHDRNILSRDIEPAENPNLNMTMFTQPGVISEITNDRPRLAKVGLTDRFDWAVPVTDQLQETTFLDHSALKAFTGDIQHPVVAAYHNLIHREVRRTIGLRGEATTWVLHRDAVNVQQDAYDEWAAYKHAYATGPTANALSKLAGKAARYARIFAQVDMIKAQHDRDVFGGVGEQLELGFLYQIDATNVQRGWDIAWWHFREMEFLFGEGASEEFARIRRAQDLLRYARRIFEDPTKGNTITVRELVRKRIGTADEVKSAAKTCAAHGWLRIEEQDRNRITYHLHPAFTRWAIEHRI